MAEDPQTNQVVPVEETRAAVLRARADLADVRRQLAAATGGASPRSILAELAQELASDLAAYFDELPMHRFSGAIARDSGLLKRLWPRMMPHRVVLGRYQTATPLHKAGSGLSRTYANIFVLALGADGVLRRGRWKGFVLIAEGSMPPLAALDWDDAKLRRVPTSMLIMRRWTGGPDPSDVASPSRVLGALTSLASRLATESKRDLELLERFL